MKSVRWEEEAKEYESESEDAEEEQVSEQGDDAMSGSESEFEQTLETLVRADLDRRADAVDPRPLFERVRRSMRSEGGDPPAASGGAHTARHRVLRFPAARPFRRLAWGAAAAAAVVLAFVFGSQVSPVRAGAEAIVREAQRSHQIPVDRCYLVEVRQDSELLQEAYPMTTQARLTRLWTRGDRFWLESVNPQQRWAWGRDDRGNVWMAFGSRRGIRFGPDELPSWLKVSFDVWSMQPDTLLGEVLRDFDLRREPPGPGQPGTTVAIRATPKPGHTHPELRGARLEFDAETKVVRKLVLERTRMGRPFATVTYTLIDTQTRDDRLFELEGHLEAPYEIYTRENEPQRRRVLAMRWLAPQIGDRPRPTTQRSPQTSPKPVND